MLNQLLSAPTKFLNPSTLVILTTATTLALAPQEARAFSLLIGNTQGNNVVQFDAETGQFLGEFISSGSGGLVSPDDLVFGPDGNLYVSSGTGSSGNIFRYNGTTGEFIDVFATGNGLVRPYGIAFGPDNYLYASSFLSDEILRFDAATGSFVDVFAAGNGVAGGLNGPNDLLFTEDGKLLVSTQGSIATPGDANGDGVVDSGEFIPDFSAGLPSQILRYDVATRTSDVLVEKATPLPTSFDFVSFLGLALGSEGDLFTTDFANGIRRYNSKTGELKQTIATDYTSTPGEASNNFIGNLAFLDDKLFTVGFDFTQANQGAILRYDASTGQPLPSEGNPGAVFVPTNDNLIRPIGIAVFPPTQPEPVPEPGMVAGLLAITAAGLTTYRKRRSA